MGVQVKANHRIFGWTMKHDMNFKKLIWNVMISDRD